MTINITLVPRAAPPDRLRVWLGVQCAAAPQLAWTLDRVVVTPTALRMIAAAIPPTLLSAGTAATNFVGVYEFTEVEPGISHAVGVQATVGADTGRSELLTTPLPAAVPPTLDRPFNVLLVSCFHQAEDRGYAAASLGALTGISKPDLTLLMGDQVYLDLPTLRNFPKDPIRLAAKFEEDYRKNWQTEVGFSNLLKLAPTASLPDDHEYWNNYPHVSPIIENSWKAPDRKSWTTAADALYEAFQFSHDSGGYAPHPGPAQMGDAQVFDVAPLSFFLADGRSRRDFNRQFVHTTREASQLAHWVNQVVTQRRIGIFISGQSLLDPPASVREGFVADYAMPNYQDFEAITKLLAAIPAAGLPLVLLTGDVHWGRVTEAKDTVSGAIIVEVISSPTSLVSSVGKDQWLRLKHVFDRDERWPRHSAADPPPQFFWSDTFGKRLRCSVKQPDPQKGNHVAVLGFTRSGSGVEMTVSFIPIHHEASVRKPRVLKPILLQPA